MDSLPGFGVTSASLQRWQIYRWHDLSFLRVFLWLLIDLCAAFLMLIPLALWQICLPPPVVLLCECVCVFVNTILARGGCRKCPWRPMTAYEDPGCVLGSCVCRVKEELFGSAECSFCPCGWMLTMGLECVFISTHGRTDCWVKMTFCQMQQSKPAGLRATVWHRESEAGIPWLSLCVSVSVLVETLRRWLF